VGKFVITRGVAVWDGERYVTESADGYEYDGPWSRAMDTSPTWVAEDYRFYFDTGAAGSSAIANQNTAVSLSPSQKFRLRVAVGETALATVSNVGSWLLQFSVNGGAFATVTTSTNVRSVASDDAAFVDASALTQALGGVTGSASYQSTWSEQDEGGTLTSRTWTDDDTEYEFCLQLHTATAGQTITFRMLSPQGTAVTFTNVPTISVAVRVLENLTVTQPASNGLDFEVDESFTFQATPSFAGASHLAIGSYDLQFQVDTIGGGAGWLDINNFDTDPIYSDDDSTPTGLTTTGPTSITVYGTIANAGTPLRVISGVSVASATRTVDIIAASGEVGDYSAPGSFGATFSAIAATVAATSQGIVGNHSTAGRADTVDAVTAAVSAAMASDRLLAAVGLVSAGIAADASTSGLAAAIGVLLAEVSAAVEGQGRADTTDQVTAGTAAAEATTGAATALAAVSADVSADEANNGTLVVTASLEAAIGAASVQSGAADALADVTAGVGASISVSALAATAAAVTAGISSGMAADAIAAAVASLSAGVGAGEQADQSPIVIGTLAAEVDAGAIASALATALDAVTAGALAGESWAAQAEAAAALAAAGSFAAEFAPPRSGVPTRPRLKRLPCSWLPRRSSRASRSVLRCRSLQLRWPSRMAR
jgi:hypothetical protein